MEEKDLIKSLKRGEEASYRELLSLYGDRLLKTCFLISKNEREAEDLVQETFIKVFKSIKKFKGNSSLYTWMYKILQNTIRDRYRNAIITVPYEEYDSSEYSLEEIIIDKENKLILRKYLDEINIIYKQVLVLFYFEDFSIKEISDILDEKEGTIRSKLSRGRKILHDNLVKGGKFDEL